MSEKGTVKFYLVERGFGFITPEFGGVDVFMHAKQMPRDVQQGLNIGDRVEFDTEQRDGRTRAAWVRRL